MSLSVRDTSGNLLTSSDSIFSGAVTINGRIYSGVIRVYNNFDQASSIPHVRKLKLFFSPVSGSVRIPLHFGDPQRDVRTNSMYNDTFSGVCTFSSKLGADPSGTLTNINNGISHSDYDEITASGSNNYNEYRLEISIRSGSILDTTSGTLFTHIEYETWL